MDFLRFIILLVFLSGCVTGNAVKIEGNVIHVEIADTPEERATGLMYRESLGEDEGMLFVFDKPEEVGFWMKNTKLTLDMIFIDENLKVVTIYEDVQPCRNIVCLTYGSQGEVKYVLEVNGGYAAEHEIALGDLVDI